MAVGYKASSIIGGPLDQDVLDQLQQRQNLYTKRSGRTSDELVYLNSKTGWVKLSSSVNVGDSSTLAKNNILFGGSFKEKSTKPKSGIDFQGVSSNTAYNNYKDSTGFRPMPGITTFEITSKNRFGTLREAKIQFQVWSVEQLSDMEQLYLRPGFSVLLEWGHSLYLDNKGKVNKSAPLTIGDYFSGSQTKSKIAAKIKELKKSSNQNYDGIFGFIKNFSWSYRTDGGYDCSLSIISSGELIESVSVALNSEENEDNLVDEEPTSIKTPVHGFLNKIINAPDNNNNNVFYSGLKKTLNELPGDLYTNFKKEAGEDIRVLRTGLTGKKAIDKDTYETTKYSLRHIKFKQLLALINAAFLLEDQNKEKLFKFSTDEEASLYLTFPDHVALDPKIAVLPKTGQFKNAKLKYEMSDRCTASSVDNSILNIRLGIDYIISTLDSTLNSSQSTVQSFIEGILSGLGMTLGGINEFGLHYDEDTFTHYVVDRRLTPNENEIKKSVFNLTGLKATVSNVSLTSKLSPSIASMIAISAQASNTDVGRDVENMFRWNEGLKDRIVEERNIKAGESLETKKKRILANVTQLARVIGTFNKTKSYSGETIDGTQNIHNEAMNFLVRKFNNSTPQAGAAGIIPFDLEVTLDGLGGIKIGQAFQINPGILPSKYDGIVGFLITGVSHVIQSNKWNTDLKAQTIIIGKPSKTETYTTDDLLGSDALQAALEGKREEGDPNVPFKIIDNETVKGTPVSPSTFGKEISAEKLLQRFNTAATIQTAFTAFFAALAQDYKEYTVTVNATFRSLQRSYELKYDKNDPSYNPNNAEPGHSAHNYGGSIDMNVTTPSGIVLRKKGDRVNWLATGIPDLAKSYGLSWGGDFSSYEDNIHFYYGKHPYKEIGVALFGTAGNTTGTPGTQGLVTQVGPDATTTSVTYKYPSGAVVDLKDGRIFSETFLEEVLIGAIF